MPYLPGKFIWFEHASSTPEVAERFYCALFGWKVVPMPMGGPEPYRMIMNGEQGLGGFNPAAAGAGRSAWMSYLSVPDVDTATAAARGAGAKVLMPPTDFGGVGRGATLADPTGAVVSVWKSGEGDPPDVDPAPIGSWYWNELWTSDTARSREFYGRVFGYTFDAMDMGPGGIYHIALKDSVARGGLTPVARKGSMNLWLPYLRVADCDASLAQAARLGAKTLVPATDIPNIGRFAIVEDPTGAAVALMRMA